jgi:aspartyl-tRNA(Asn)/glutamyl-tRNA(Gln) amidotransferase subunit B
VAHWFIGDVAKHLNERGQEAELADTPVTPAHVAELVTLVESNTITAEHREGRPRHRVRERRDAGGDRRGAWARRRSATRAPSTRGGAAIEANPKAVEDYRGGKKSAIGFLVGQVMRETKGRADANGLCPAPRAWMLDAS